MTDFSKLREHLLAQQSMRLDLKSEYERKMEAMFEQKKTEMETKILTPAQRIGCVLATLLGLAFFVGGGYAAWSAPAGFPILARAAFIIASVFGLVMAVFDMRIAIRGRYHRKHMPNLQTYVVWAVICIQTTVAMMLAQGMEARPYRGTTMLITSLIFFVMGVAFVIKNLIEQSTLKVQEDLLRVQIQIAELSERVNK